MELCDVMNGVDYEILKHGKNSLEVRGVSIDSRNCQAGYIFVCIKGLTVDGHDFAEKAVENGATVIVSEIKTISLPEGVTVIFVESTRDVLNVIAANFYGNPSRRMRIIGVTGTSGKTSTTCFIETILRQCGYTVGVIGTSGARVQDAQIDIKYATSTTPDVLELHAIFDEMAKRGTNYVVMEVSSHALALDKVAGIRFDAGVFTNFSQDHLDFHKTMDEYFSAKLKLFGLSNIGVINADDEKYNLIQKHVAIPIFTYGIENKSDFYAENVKTTEDGVSFDLAFEGEIYKFAIPVAGRFSAYNLLCAVSTALALKMPPAEVCAGAAKIRGVRGRIEKVENKRNFNVYIDYAHKPDALEKVIKTVREFTSGRVITVFGCGGNRDKEKRPIMGRIASTLSDLTIITSDNPRNEDPNDIIRQILQGVVTGEYLTISDRREAIFESIKRAHSGDSVIIAGKGHEDYQEFENRRKIHFDDAEIAKEALGGDAE